MRSLIVVLSLVPAVAFAQPGASDPPPPADPQPGEPQPGAPQPAEPPAEPAPASTAPVEPATPPPAAPTAAPEEAAPTTAPPEHPRRGMTGEIGAGLGMVAVGGQSETIRGLAGLDLGVGGFVTPSIALTARLSGVTVMENGLIYVGVVGPHVQGWLAPQLWVGGGLGIGFYAGCAGDACGGEKTTGYDFRVGYAFAPDGHGVNLSLELNRIDAGGNNTLSLLGLLLGYQGF